VTDESALPPDLREFLSSNIESYEQLEVLRLLGKSPKLAWRVPAIAQKSQLAESVVEDVLLHLCSKGLVASVPGRIEGFHHAPSNLATLETVARVIEFYEARPLELMKVMTANSIERLRANAAGAFDALLTNRKKDDG
jgi:DNA-binding IscR family transcriptional regulator